MQDVAKAAGFSQATVSIVLNDTPGYQITLETRRRIEEAAASLNYPMSPSRRRGTAVHKIALVVDGFSSPEILEIAEGARQEAWKTEHLIVVYADFTVPATEAMILEVLMRAGGRVLTREYIGEHAWDDNFDPMSNVIDVYIARLRRKVDSGEEVPLLTTVRGAGYRLSAPDARG